MFALRKPITGIAGCCVRAAIGHAAAAPKTGSWMMKAKSSADVSNPIR
jgi:hypothetical protein